MHAATKLADVPKHVTPACSARSHSVPRSGCPGLPSNSTTDASVSRPPFRKFHIIQPVVVNQKTRSSACRSTWRWSIFSISSRIPPCPCTIAFGSPVVPELYSTHSGWSNGTCANASSSSAPSARKSSHRVALSSRRGRARVEVADHDRALQGRQRLLEQADDVEPSVLTAPVAVAVDREQHARLDLREPVDHAAHAEVRRAARPDGADGRAGVEADDRLDDVRQVRDDAVPGADAARAERRRRVSRRVAQLAPGRLRERAELRRVPDGDGRGIIAAKDVLGVVETRAGEPLGSRHRPRAQHALVGRGGLHVEVLPDRGPERLDLGHRPPPELVVPARLDSVAVREPAGVARELGALHPLRRGRPQHGRSHAVEPTPRARCQRCRKVIRPRVRSYGESSTVTRSPGLMRIR